MNYILIILTSWIYVYFGHGNLDYFLEHIAIYLVICFHILIIIYLYFKNKRKEKKLHFKNYFSFVCFGISIAIFLNMIIFYFSSSVNNSSVPIFLAFLSSGIIGPIYEEILFRYIFLNRLRNKYSEKIAILICTIVFSLMHFSILHILYAFVIGLFLSIIYIKKETIIAPILVHISANSIVLFLNGFHLNIFLLSIVNLIITCYLIFKN